MTVESISVLGDRMGVRLIHWDDPTSRTPSEFRELFDRSGGFPDEIPEFAYLGSIEPKDMPAQTLHELVVQRNKQLVGLFREYSELVGQWRCRIFNTDNTDIGIEQFRERCKLPPLEQSATEVPHFQKPYLRAVSAKYGLSSIGRDNYQYGQFKDDSIAGASLIPDLQIYLDYFANNAPNSTQRNPSANPKFTRDILGWKNYFETLDPYLTSFFFRPITAFVPFDSFKRHAYIIGGSGSGKSELIKFIMHHIITAKSAKNYGAVVIDPHGDLAEEIARFKDCKNNDRIVFFDPESPKCETPSLNIFHLPDDDERTVDIVAGNIADAFEEIIADSSISAQMRALLIPCISVILRRNGGSLSDLQRFMVDGENEDLIAEGCKSPNAGHATFFKQKFETKTYAPTKASIYTRLQTLLNSTMFRRMLNPKATLNLEEELNNGKIVIFSLSKSSIGNDVSGALGRFIVAQIKNIGFRRAFLSKSKRVPTFVFIDECQNYIGESIETTLTELRKYGIHMILANQVLGQNMSSGLEKIILGNTGVKFAGYNGEASHTKMAKELNVDVDELKALTTGKFCCKTRDPDRATHPFILKVPGTLVGNNRGMIPQDWYEQKKRGWRGYVKNEELDNLSPVKKRLEGHRTVSYTHLTLPTNREV